jgi:chromosome segregation ATPase
VVSRPKRNAVGHTCCHWRPDQRLPLPSASRAGLIDAVQALQHRNALLQSELETASTRLAEAVRERDALAGAQRSAAELEARVAELQEGAEQTSAQLAAAECELEALAGEQRERGAEGHALREALAVAQAEAARLGRELEGAQGAAQVSSSGVEQVRWMWPGVRFAE